MSQIQEHFLRYEFKYILNETLRADIEKELSHFMQLDPFVRQFENKKYFVRSLYFDDPFYSFYYEKTDGLMHRQKFRIRTYTKKYDKDIPIMLELKGRYNNFVYKHRTSIKFKSKNIKDTVNALLPLENEDNSIARQYTYDRYKKNIKPVMLIDYQRRAFQSKYDYLYKNSYSFEGHQFLQSILRQLDNKGLVNLDFFVGVHLQIISCKYH